MNVTIENSPINQLRQLRKSIVDFTPFDHAVEEEWFFHVMDMFATSGFGTWRYMPQEEAYVSRKKKQGGGEYILRYSVGTNADRLFHSLLFTFGMESAFNVTGNKITLGTRVPYGPKILSGGINKEGIMIPPRDFIHIEEFKKRLQPILDKFAQDKVKKTQGGDWANETIN